MEWIKKLCRTSNKRGKKRILFDSRLDKLSNIFKYKCDIQKCFDAGCDGCEFEAHIVNCKCHSDTKVRNIMNNTNKVWVILIPHNFVATDSTSRAIVCYGSATQSGQQRKYTKIRVGSRNN